MLDEPCLNMTESECTAREPLDRPRLWERGEFCDAERHHCPLGACVVARTGPGCMDENCQWQVCADDDWCCRVDWDPLCVLKAEYDCVTRDSQITWCGRGSTSTGVQGHEVSLNSTQILSNVGNGSWTEFSCDSPPNATEGMHHAWFYFFALNPPSVSVFAALRRLCRT